MVHIASVLLNTFKLYGNLHITNIQPRTGTPQIKKVFTHSELFMYHPLQLKLAPSGLKVTVIVLLGVYELVVKHSQD